ncbi:hypothetical protein ACFV4N_21285 [Actinosynnema sp. NPDC059797]
MSRPALFTYAGALRVLGRYERPVFDKADVALGGAVLAAGGDVLGLIDPKNEAMGSLRKVLDGVSAKLTGLSGVDRQELVAAAHLASPDSTALPLLVLGHPGAGKSLLMGVLAAKVPALGYAVVNARLREVDAEDSPRRPGRPAVRRALPGGAGRRAEGSQPALRPGRPTRPGRLSGWSSPRRPARPRCASPAPTPPRCAAARCR